jgi:hypothetical protein
MRPSKHIASERGRDERAPWRQLHPDLHGDPSFLAGGAGSVLAAGVEAVEAIINEQNALAGLCTTPRWNVTGAR